MYDFVSDKFDKMGLSFLNSVAKMVSSAASAKLMDLMFGDFAKGRWAAYWRCRRIPGEIGSSVMGFFGFSSKSAKGNVFTNGIVNRAVAFPWA